MSTASSLAIYASMDDVVPTYETTPRIFLTVGYSSYELDLSLDHWDEDGLIIPIKGAHFRISRDPTETMAGKNKTRICSRLP